MVEQMIEEYWCSVSVRYSSRPRIVVVYEDQYSGLLSFLFTEPPVLDNEGFHGVLNCLRPTRVANRGHDLIKFTQHPAGQCDSQPSDRHVCISYAEPY